MTSTLLQSLSTDTSIGTFFSWWRRELSACLPKGLRSLLEEREASDALLLTKEGCKTLSPRGARKPISGPVQAYLADDLTIADIVSLPEGARSKLRNAVAYEIDRITPFSADDVYFDCRVIGRGAQEGQLDVAILMAPRAQVDPLLGDAETNGFDICALDAAAQHDGMGTMRGAGYNLLAGTGRSANSRTWAAFYALVFLLASAALLSWSAFERRDAVLDAYQNRITELRRIALNNSPTDNDFNSAFEQQAAAALGKVAPLTVLLEDISQRVGDDTFLMSLRRDGNRLSLSGVSKRAADLLPELNASPLLTSPAFAAPIVKDPSSGLERFTLTTEILSGGAL